MNQTNEFCQTTAKFIPPFRLSFSPHSTPPPPLLFLHSQALVLDANQVPKPSQNQAMQSKAKIMLDEFVYQWKNVVLLIPNGL